MSRSYRSAVFTAGAIILALALVGSTWLFLVYEREQFRAHQDTEPDNSKPASQQAKDACRELTRLPEYEKCLAEYAKAERVEQREQHDLKAQQDMAGWALAMLLASLTIGVASLVVATLVAWYVRNTLRETRRTAAAGITSARVSNKAVLHAQDTAKRQLRAYLLVESAIVTFDKNKEWVEYFIQLRNFGQTPAYRTKMHFEATFFEQGKVKFPTFQAKRVEALTQVDLGGTALFTVRERVTTRNEAEFEAIKAERLRMIVGGHVNYVDVFNDPQTLDFRGIVTNLPEKGWVLCPTAEGNKAS
jgi:hypothetical protein